MKRQIEFTIGDDMKITPTAVQEGGVQGEHNAAQVIFHLPEALETGYQLFLEAVDGSGGYDRTPALTVSAGAVTQDIPRAWTNAGGVLLLRLSAVAADADGTVTQTIYTFDARLRLHSREAAQPGAKALLEKQLEEQLAKTEAAVARANAEAEAAAASAAAAQTSAENASKSEAASDAAAAAASAQEAAEAASAADDSAETAAGNAADASASAETAAASASAAASSAGAASSSANAAASSASAAASSKAAAASYASAAEASAGNAAASESAAGTSASAAASSAESSAASASEAQAAVQNLLNLVYPVGSIYMSVNSTSPATLFGGTWTRIQDRFLLAAGRSYTANTTGGEATHKLTVSEMPSHNHAERFCWSSAAAAKNTLNVSGTALTATSSVSGVAGIDRGDSFGNYSGGGSAHNNMPPYLAVYMWKRTA